MTDDEDFYRMQGKYTNGKFAYLYPSWMTCMVYGGYNPSTQPQPIAELYEIYNPKGEQYVEGATYDARVIPFDDGEMVEIIEQIPDKNESKSS